MSTHLNLFPFPTFSDGQRQDGSLIGWPERCRRCPERECQTPQDGGISTCRFGMNFAWASDVMAGGVVVTDLETATKAAIDRRRSEKPQHVRKAVFQQAVEALQRLDADAERSLQEYAERRIHEYEDTEGYREDLLGAVADDLNQNLNVAHDFLSLLAQIKSNVMAILERERPGVPLHDAAEQMPNEGAIYFGAEVMALKLDSTRFLTDPSLMNAPTTVFQLHPYCTKYFRIYRARARERGIELVQTGSAFGRVRGVSDAIGTLVHNLLDNAVKYAPSSSRVEMDFSETADFITLRLKSLGPRIEDGERREIFRAGFRTRAAQARESSGMGLGLAVSKLVSDQYGLKLYVDQSAAVADSHPGFFPTEFCVRFDRIEDQ